MTVAPARRARTAVSSSEPSFTTTTWASGMACRARWITRATESASLKAGMTTQIREVVAPSEASTVGRTAGAGTSGPVSGGRRWPGTGLRPTSVPLPPPVRSDGATCLGVRAEPALVDVVKVSLSPGCIAVLGARGIASKGSRQLWARCQDPIGWGRARGGSVLVRSGHWTLTTRPDASPILIGTSESFPVGSAVHLAL